MYMIKDTEPLISHLIFPSRAEQAMKLSHPMSRERKWQASYLYLDIGIEGELVISHYNFTIPVR